MSIRWYGVLIASSMALGLWLGASCSPSRVPYDLLKAAEIALIGAAIRARLYDVFETSDYYQTQPRWRIFAVWEGGLAIHGGLIVGLLTGGADVWAKGATLTAGVLACLPLLSAAAGFAVIWPYLRGSTSAGDALRVGLLLRPAGDGRRPGGHALLRWCRPGCSASGCARATTGTQPDGLAGLGTERLMDDARTYLYRSTRAC